MSELSMPKNVKGNGYVQRAIMLYLSLKGRPRILTTKIYPQIADEFLTSAHCVERNIRHCISVAWRKSDPTVISRLLGKRYINQCPTNAEFILTVAEKIGYNL